MLAERYAEPISAHPLRAQIISTVTVNRLLNVAGVTFVFRAMEETGASALEVVRAASAAMEIFGIDRIWDQVNAQDGRIPTNAQVALHLETRRLLDRATRWFLQTRGGALDVQSEVDRFAPVVAAASGGLGEIIEDGVTGLLVPVGDAEAMAKAIISVLNGDERKPPKSWLRQFEFEPVLHHYLAILGLDRERPQQPEAKRDPGLP